VITTIAIALALAALGSQATGDTVFALPKDSDPRAMAVASDGAVWTVDDFAGVTRLDPSGRTQDFLPREDFLNDVMAGPNGSVWVFGGDKGLQLIDRAGRVTKSAAKPEYWFGDIVTEGGKSSLGRSNRDGTTREFPFPEPHDVYDINDVVQAADGTVWFTEPGLHGRSWIGEMTAAGKFTHWPLPPAVGAPDRLVAGADGAMWFTGRHVIARITPAGQVASFRLAGHAAPHDIVAGPQGALWFVSDACLGRVTSAGALTTWPLAGASRLERIADAGDGTLWVMDRLGNAMHRVNPAADVPGPCGAPTLTHQVGAITATLAFQRYEADVLGDLQIHITRRGQEVFSEAVPGIDGGEARMSSKDFTVRDLDGDGEPEVILTVNWSGTQCCVWSRIYGYDRKRGTYTVRRPFWGYYAATPKLRDLDGDRRIELVSLDDRFSRQFAWSLVRPIRIWSFHRGRLRDVTRRYPALIRKDAAELWRLYLRERKSFARGVLPAWVADQYLLGRQAQADRVLQQAYARGEFERADGYKPRRARDFFGAVKAFLRSHGY
jgi:virginiamycin B lyase